MDTKNNAIAKEIIGCSEGCERFPSFSEIKRNYQGGKKQYRFDSCGISLPNRDVCHCSLISIWNSTLGYLRTHSRRIPSVCVPPNAACNKYSFPCWSRILVKIVRVWNYLWEKWKLNSLRECFTIIFKAKSQTIATARREGRKWQELGEDRMICAITYDLNQGIFHSYNGFIQEIQHLGPWAKYMDKTWIVATHASLEEISRRLIEHLDQRDRLLIVRLEAGQYQGWLPDEIWDWINHYYPEYGYR